ncbi:ABC transporter permease [Phaeobacter sp.]|uniref:FtsX-like permease family protein n=1 Tax=Phaeobacter sp. TaxID=1902409 RepID=UPI0025E9E9E3|nr:ABC transporter permease [Phaeobacter sp.]
MIWAAFATILSHWRRHKLQLAMLVVGLALATALWSAVQAINAEARASYAEAAGQISPDRQDRLVGPEGQVTLAQYQTLRRSGWQVTPVVEMTLGTGNRQLELIGIDVLSNPLLADLMATQDDADAPQTGEPSTAQPPTPADLLLAPGRMFAHPETQFPTAPAGQSWPPIIRSEQVPRGLGLADLSTVVAMAGTPDRFSHLVLLPNQPKGVPPLAEITPELRRQTAASGADTAQLTESFHLNLTAFGLLSFAVGLFIVQGTVALGIEQRRGLFRTLRSLGIPLKTLITIIFLELFAITLLAASLGLVLGFVLAGLLLPGVSATLSGLYGARVDGSLTLQWHWVLSGLAMAVGGMILAGAQSCLSIAKLPIMAPPAAAARGQQACRNHRRTAAVGALLLLGSGILPVAFDGLLAGFVFVGALMIGAALLLPWALSHLLRFGTQTARGPLAQWLWADMRAQLPGLSLALMALLLALATNIGVGTMVSSFRLTFVGWLDQRLASEMYLTIPAREDPAAITDWLTENDVRVLPIRHSDERYEGLPLEVYGVADDPTYRLNWPLLDALPSVWDKIAAGDGILINEQFARRENLSPGDQLRIASDWEAEVLGIYSDYGNPHLQAIAGLDLVVAKRPSISNRRFGLRMDETQIAPVRQQLQDRFDLPATAFINQSALKAQSLQIFDRTFVVTAALNLLTLGVAGFAILTSLLTLWNQRLPQLAPIWAMGITRRQLAWCEILRSVLLAALTAVLALPLGLALGWALLAVVNVEAFGWRLPMALFPLDWLRLLALALLAAAIAAALPARKLSRLHPADLQRVFSNER